MSKWEPIAFVFGVTIVIELSNGMLGMRKELDA